MAALVQHFPQQTGTTTMLQSRPSNNTNAMHPTQSHANHQYMGSPQAPRSPYGQASNTGYRGSSAPIQQYAFTSTPSLNNVNSWQQNGAYRTISSPSAATAHQYEPGFNPRTVRSNMQATAPNGYSHSMGVSQNGSRDDSAIMSTRSGVVSSRRSSYIAGQPQQLNTHVIASKTTPERYRRPSASATSTTHSRSQSLTLPNLSNAHMQPNLNTRPSSFYGTMPNGSFDDVRSQRLQSRGVHNVNAESRDQNALHPGQSNRNHSRDGSAESGGSSRSSQSRPSSATHRSASAPSVTVSSTASLDSRGSQEQGVVNVPARHSSNDAMKRSTNPSPLSKPATMANDPDSKPTNPPSYAAVAAGTAPHNGSPAAKQLAAISQKDGKAKSKTARLRRAFSFGSAAELKRAGAGAGAGDESETVQKTEPSKLHKDPTPEEAYDAEQARIAEAQEAGGIGNSIYGGRFRFGSTDNLSISSTASSASVMIRKMGRGMKKSGRSLAGLFRPKSVIGVPAAEPFAPEASEATVSMVTAEAETKRVNVTPDPQTTTGFPQLQLNSVENSGRPMEAFQQSKAADSPNSSRVTVGSERERAEVLAAVRKGILKRSGSPVVKNAENNTLSEYTLPNIPVVSDSPLSSVPSTPNDEAQGHRRTGSVSIGNEDYFMSALRLRHEAKSAPGTPQGSAKRNATFSPRIIFHDTWPSQEYDRRGEIATCNRLTPMLAQQIKEELNSFKMEMEVHENSKIYTHFF